ncbi:tetratricopeptide repeat protein [Chitiniphilus purpureus]|uniref:Tetratricopeptide repeat protein n=1 Tax=Chitiniphilus purpureus TaxID=2981137 RepID=A0ABY6DP59_9NEIS|nr:tetratricopeptide repeat protein [Chitiniphilus sp. CD1]UXY16164.1 tetratricopeptide repeat protein [Chitiniphilus sp. CD1]
MSLSPRACLSALLSAALAAAVGGCATPARPAAAPTAASEPAAAASEPAAAVASVIEAPEPDYPKQALTVDLLLRFLVGDIALQRGEMALASQAWTELRQHSADPRVAKRATEVAIAAGQLNQAIEAAQSWVSADPGSVDARQVMLSLLIRANRLSEAKPHIEALFKARPQETAPFLAQMHRLWDKQTDRAAALKLTQELAAAHPQLPEAHFALAVAHANAGQQAEAQRELNQAEALRPGWETSLLYRAQLLNDAPLPQRIAQLEQAARQAPKSVAIHNALGRLYAEAKRYRDASLSYETALALQPADLEALVGSGLVAIELREYEKANSRLASAVARAPNHTANLRFYLGQVAEELRHYEEAARWYAQTDGELQSAAQRRLASVYVKLGQLDEARAVVGRMPAQTREAQVEKAQLEAQLWREAGNLPRAYTVLTEALKRFPEHPDLLYDRSLISDLNGNYAESEADLRRYLALKPENAMGLNALGYTLVNRTDRVDEAARYIEQAIALEPENPVILDSLAWLRFKQGRLEEAEQLLSKVHAQLPDPEIAAHWAEVLWQMGRRQQAREVLQKALARDASNEVLLDTGKRLGLHP